MKALLLACLICLASTLPSFAGGCLLSLTKHEQRSGAAYKICWYNCAGGEVAVTIRSTRPCPLKVER